MEKLTGMSRYARSRSVPGAEHPRNRVGGSALALCAAATLGACGQSDAGSGGGTPTYHVTGAIVQAGTPVPDVPVSIDGAANWTAVTDANGRFDIEGVPAGAHTIDASASDANGTFSERQLTLQVIGNVDLAALILPQPLVLAAPVVEGTQVQVAWQATDADDFREYKLYRRDSPGIDETTGDLVYVSTEREQTNFVDGGLLAGKRYYYRVYVMNELGRLGGSNIASTQVDVANLLAGGDFEAAGVLAAWTVDPGPMGGAVTRDDTVAHGGVASLHMTSGTWAQTIDPIAIQKDVAYDLGLFIKLHGQRHNIDDAWIGVYQGAALVASFPIDVVAAGTARDQDVDWFSVSQVFNVAGEGAITLRIGCYSDDTWIDDLVVRPHQPATP